MAMSMDTLSVYKSHEISRYYRGEYNVLRIYSTFGVFTAATRYIAARLIDGNV